jgi:mono/diheme cytochrome c family protein
MTLFSSSVAQLRSSAGRWVGRVLFAAGCLLLLAGCQATGDMNTQPYNRPLSSSDFFSDGRSARLLVAGTVPQTDLAADDPILTGKDASGQPLTGFPLPLTNELVTRGQERFGIFCVVCHGVDGHGDGKVVPFGLSKPPDLLGESTKEFSTGQIFDTITNGQGNMFPYGYRIKPQDRWAVVAYLRAMQLKNGHLTQDLTPDELQQLGK